MIEKLLKNMGILSSSIKQHLQRCRKKYEILKKGEQLIRGRCLRIPCSGAVVEVCLGGVVGKTLQLQPDLLPEASPSDDWPSYWVVNTKNIATGVGGFLRLEPKQNLILGRHAQEQSDLFDYSTQVDNRHLDVLHQGEYLQLTDLGSEGGTCVRLLPNPEHCLSSWRRSQLQRVAELFSPHASAKKGEEGEKNVHKSVHSSMMQPLSESEAMACLRQAHRTLLKFFSSSPLCLSSNPSSEEHSSEEHSSEEYSSEESSSEEYSSEERSSEERSSEEKKKKKKKKKKEKGKKEKKVLSEPISKAPALVHLSADTIPVLVGDLHGKVDNLLTILTTGCLLTALENATVTLVFLGDAVHPDEIGQLAEMDSSMLIMDLILTLMSHYPGQVVYLRGNHDGFSEEIYKGNVCQGQVWSRALIQTRGKAYRNAMKAFYRDLPYVAVHPRLLAAHAAPPVVKVTKETLLNLRHIPELVHQLTWNRMHQTTRPGGYREKDIKNFRHIFNLPKNTAVVVGHTIMDRKNTAWLHAGGMEQHHILYSGLKERVGWMICFPGGLVHMECPVAHPSSVMLPSHEHTL